MKKQFTLALLLAFTFNFVSCNNDDDDNADPRDKFTGTYAGTLTCTPGISQAENVQVIKGPTVEEIELVGYGKATLNGTSFTVPTKSTSSNGFTTNTSVSGNFNAEGTTLSLTRNTGVLSPMIPIPIATSCSGNLAKQ